MGKHIWHKGRIYKSFWKILFVGRKNKMIDVEKWNAASDEVKMQAVKTIKAIMNENAVTKADNAIITEYLLGKVEGEQHE